MPATDSDAPKDEERTLTNIPCSAPAATVLSSSPLVLTSSTPNFTGEAVIEMKAVSMASSNCSSAFSSPAEASPAKPAVTSPTTTFDGEVGTSPATSHIASASDSLKCTGTSLLSLSEEVPPSPVLPSAVFGSPDPETDYPAVLTFKGVSVTLENNSVWKQFHGCGTEMILTKQGRRMFPYCRYRLSGLDPEQRYSLVLSIVPSYCSKYRWNISKWETNGPAEYHNQGLIRAFSHHFSPCRGSEWMSSLLSFYKLKLTNNLQDQDGHIILQSMHRYIPRLHVIPVLDGVVPTPDQPVIMGPESMTFTFPQTEFMAVTTYQNFRITQLKINHNPFAKGFREDGNNPRLNRVSGTGIQPVTKTDPQLTILTSELDESTDAAVPLSMKDDTVAPSPSIEQKTRLVLKPIMSTNTSKDEPYVPCIRGKHALGELVLVQKQPRVEPGEESQSVTVTPKLDEVFSLMPETVSSTSTTSTPRSSPGYRKRKKRINRHWGNSRGREWKAASASPTVVHSPSLTVAMQPELDDVEGLLFVSFTSQEALDVHVRDKPADNSSPASAASATTQMQLKQRVEVFPETDEEKITRLEAILLQDLHTLKHRQVIHPVLREVGLKLSSLDPAVPIDLQYLGVKLPLPPLVLPAQVAVDSPADEQPFISRTGKTSDMTKIKGWRNKFIRHKETSPSSCDGSQKNLSAFCSNMLDEYLESEAQNISERAAAFSTNPEGSVAYQLPAKSSSYVKTLDSALKHRNAASRFPQGSNRPCPLSHKPLLYSALTSSPPPLPGRPATPVQAEAEPMQEHTPSHLHPGAVTPDAESGSSVSRKSPMGHLGFSQRPAAIFRQSQGLPYKLSGYTKPQMRLLQMESGAVSEGLHRTQLTHDRLSAALSVMLTKKTLPCQITKTPHCPKTEDRRPACGKDFCRLGCLCSALQYLHKGPDHCRRPECMFDCGCDVRQRAAGRKVPGSFANKLWKNNINEVDPDPVFVPTSASATCPAPLKSLKRSHIARPVQPSLQVQEEDKDPVYKYFESLMTCARVREFNSKPPLQVPRPGVPDTTPSNAATKPRKAPTDDEPKMYYRTITTIKKSGENTSANADGNEAEARKQIEIQSACEWDKDRKMVLEALCRRLSQNRLPQWFNIGPYYFRLISKICMRKPSGSCITYRVLISKPSKLPEEEEEEEYEGDESDEDKHANKSSDWDLDSEEEHNNETPLMTFGVMPFLSGVLPAGRLQAKTKPVGSQANGLIQVNGKFYNQARLLLGNMGSLHPANRLAAYITGRLQVPVDISKRNAPKTHPTTQKKTTEQKTSTQAAVQAAKPQPQHSQSSSTVNHVPTFVFGQHNSFQSNSTSSPVSLTVSPALKTPSFLGQSGTYSFRICPPTLLGIRDQSLPGVTLPGGFTLIQLPKSAGDGAQQSKLIDPANIKTEENSPSSPKHALFNLGSLGADSSCPSVTGAKDLLHSSSELMCDEKILSDQSSETQSKQLDPNLDDLLEDLTSDSSDYYVDGDEYEEDVDIETVEEARQKTAIDKLREALHLNESRDSSDDFASAVEQSDENGGSKVDKRRKNHTVLERQRRSEQRVLFDKLQSVLGADPGVPRLRVLSMALKEIQKLVDKSKYLEQKKKLLTRIQTVYVKELSVLSGKSDLVIKHKLKEIYNKQKMREQTIKWKPLTSYLPQSTSANQAASPKSERSPMSLLKSHIYKTLSQDSSLTADGKKPTPRSRPTGLFSQAQIDGTFLRQQGDPGLLAKGTMSDTKTEPLKPSGKSAPQVSTVQDSTLTASLPPNNYNSNSSPGSFAIPLMRSKTGRLILPSSMKPAAQGIYTLMLMNAKQEPKDSEVTVAPSVSDREKSSGVPICLSDSEKCGVAKDKTVQNSYLVPKHSGGNNPLVELNLLNKSISVPSTAPQAAGYRQEAGTALGLTTNTSTCLSSNTVQKISPTSVKPEPGLSPPRLSPPDLSPPRLSPPDLSPLIFRRGRGRPRKHSTTPDSQSRKPAVEGNAHSYISEIDTSTLVQPRPNDRIPPGEDDASQGGDKKALQAKRGRGRPPKKKPLHLMHSRVTSSSSKESDDGPFRRSLAYQRVVPKPEETPPAATSLRDGASSRPLTRGALGKDFPSAKKRSWIDVEKELEPDLDDE